MLKFSTLTPKPKYNYGTLRLQGDASPRPHAFGAHWGRAVLGPWGTAGPRGGGCDPPQWSQNCGTEGAKHYKDAGTTLKLRGGGGETSPGVQGNPYPKLKTILIWSTIFLKGPKLTCNNEQK